MNVFDKRGQTVGVQVNGKDAYLKIEIERLAKHARKAVKDGRNKDADNYLAQILALVQ